MKRLWLAAVVGLVLCGLAGETFAEVQNIRVSGDIRIRGYYLNNLDLSADDSDLPTLTVVDETTGESIEMTGNAADEDSFWSQRTRVTVEADLEEQVLAVATVQGEGAWGSSVESDSMFPETEDFEASLNEAYVQLQEMWYTPATLKLGRQFLHYGRGLILSSKEYELHYDAVRFVWDQYPLTMDFVYAKSLEGLQSENSSSAGDDENLWYANARYEFEESVLQDVELYLGYLDSDRGASPGIVGLRGDVTPTEEWTTWGELGYEFGDTAANESLSAWVLDLGAEYIMSRSAMEPKITLGWTYASGDQAGKETFVPWGDYNYWGYVFSPTLSNIHILNAAVEVLPVENLSLGLEFYYYLQDEAAAAVVGSPYKDNGGVIALTNGSDENLGAELDFVVGYDYSNDVRTQVYVGAFLPGDAYQGTSGDDEAVEVRGEVQVNF